MQLLHRQRVFGGHGCRSRHILWDAGSCPLWGELEEPSAPSFRLHALPPNHCGRAPGTAHHCRHIRWVFTRNQSLVCAMHVAFANSRLSLPVIGEIFEHNRLRSWCLQVQPVGYMLTSSGFPLLKLGCIRWIPLKWLVILMKSWISTGYNRFICN